jgi:hypothetical protein
MKLIYKAVLLTPESKAKLMATFPPSFDETFYHHMTIEFGIKQIDNDVGSEVELKVTGYKRDDKGEAVVVQGVPRKDGKTPHITLSVAPGVKPVYSNELMKSGWTPVDGPVLKGIISVYTDAGWINKA